MIIFHVKRDGTVKTEPLFVPQGSSLADLVVLSEFDYALCTIKLSPVSGVQIPDLICNFVMPVDGIMVWMAHLPSEVSKVPGSVGYQLIFTAADGTQQGTLEGSFDVPRGIITNMPETVEGLEQTSIDDLYTLLSNIVAIVTGLNTEMEQVKDDILNINDRIDDLEEKHDEEMEAVERDVRALGRDLEELSTKHDEEVLNLENSITELEEKHDEDLRQISEEVARGGPLASVVGTVVISTEEWNDNDPLEANTTISGIDDNTMVLLAPANDETREAMASSGLHVRLETLDPEDDTVSIVVGGYIKPKVNLTFRTIVLKGNPDEFGVALNAPTVSFVGGTGGVDGGGGGIHIGSDEPPDTAKIWIDPSGDSTDTEAWEFELEDGSTKTKQVVVLN